MDSLCSKLERKKTLFFVAADCDHKHFFDSDNLGTIPILNGNSHICYGLSLTVPNNTLRDTPFSKYTWYSGQPSFHHVHTHTHSPQDKWEIGETTRDLKV